LGPRRRRKEEAGLSPPLPSTCGRRVRSTGLNPRRHHERCLRHPRTLRVMRRELETGARGHLRPTAPVPDPTRGAPPRLYWSGESALRTSRDRRPRVRWRFRQGGFLGSRFCGDRQAYFRMKEAVSSAVSVPCFTTKRKVKSPGSRRARGTVATNWMRPSLSGSPSCTGPLPRT